MKGVLLSSLFLAALALGDSAAGAAAADEAVVIPANHPHVQIVGRVDDSDPARPRFSFPGVTIRARFQAPRIALLLEDEGLGDIMHMNVYTVLINGTPVKPLVPIRDVSTYVLADGLGEGVHTVEIRKRTEGNVGAARFLGFELSQGGEIVEPPPRSERRIEFIGDSITCGYGIMHEGDPPKETFSSINENHDVAYGSLTAAMLGAESHTVACSGRGIYRSFGGQTITQIPRIYHRALADDARPAWNHARWHPQVIVVSLGTNDFSQPGLRDEDFRRAYARFLEEIRAIHPEAQIICCLGPMMNDGWPVGERSLSRAREIITGIIEQRAARGDNRLHYHEFELQQSPYGEAWHPTRATHRKMAESLSARIAEIMEWRAPHQ